MHFSVLLIAAGRFDIIAERFDQNYRREFVAKCVAIGRSLRGKYHDLMREIIT